MNSSGKPAFGTICLLEAALGADEDDAARGIAREVLARDGDGGVDVSPRPAPRDHQCLSRPSHPSRFLNPIVVRNSAAVPTAMRLAISDEPP